MPAARAAASDEVLAAPRSPVLLQGLIGAAVGAALAGLALLGTGPMLAGVALLQLLLVLGFLALVDAPAAVGVFGLACLAAVASDVVVAVDHGRVAGLGAVVALALVAALLQQLVRRGRTRVTEVLADSLVAVVLVACAACLTAALELAHATDRPVVAGLVVAGLVAAAVALLAGRATDGVLSRHPVTVGATRGWPGTVAGLLLGTIGAIAVAPTGTTSARIALLGLAASAVVVVVDLAVDLAAADLRPGPADVRRVAALRPVLALLPYALLGPVLLLGTRLLEGLR